MLLLHEQRLERRRKSTRGVRVELRNIDFRSGESPRRFCLGGGMPPIMNNASAPADESATRGGLYVRCSRSRRWRGR